MVNAVIVGTGDLAYALAHLFSINNSSSSGNFLEVTKTSIKENGSTFHETGVPLTNIDEALEQADVVILAIPARALKSFVPNYVLALKEKILVDCTNSTRKGEDLDTLLSSTSIKWVKAFNDIGASDILLNKAGAKKKVLTKMCSPSKTALSTVQRFAEQSFGFDVKLVPYERYGEVVRSQSSIGYEWTHATWIMLIIFAITEFYALWRYNVEKGYAWYHLPIQVTNKAICWTAITGLALTQLPGVIARIINVVRPGNLSKISPTLKWSLGIRKHLGLLSLWFLGVHIFMSLLLMGPAYYSKFYVDPDAANSKMNAIGETSFLFAILGSMLYFILGVASLPSVGANMTNKQWQLVYGPVAWAALSFGTSHVVVMGYKGWNTPEKWPGSLPPITMTSTVIPMFVIVLKLVELVITSLSRLAGRTTSTSDDELHYIRTLIQAGTAQQDGNTSDDTKNSGESGAHSTVSYDKATGDFELQLDSNV